MERLSVDSESAGGFAFVAAAVFERDQNDLPFDFLQEAVDRNRRRRRCLIIGPCRHFALSHRLTHVTAHPGIMMGERSEQSHENLPRNQFCDIIVAPSRGLLGLHPGFYCVDAFRQVHRHAPDYRKVCRGIAFSFPAIVFRMLCQGSSGAASSKKSSMSSCMLPWFPLSEKNAVRSRVDDLRGYFIPAAHGVDHNDASVFVQKKTVCQSRLPFLKAPVRRYFMRLPWMARDFS